MPSPHWDEDGKVPTYAFPGGYPMYYLMADNEILCPDCANMPEAYTSEEKRTAIRTGKDQEEGAPDYTDREWEITAADIHYEGLPLVCANCNKEIPSAYGPTNYDYHDMVQDWARQILGYELNETDADDALEFVKGKDSDQEGNYNQVGKWVKEFIESNLEEPEDGGEPVDRQQTIANPITYETYRHGGYIVTEKDTGKDILIQTDYEFPDLAITFGWNGKLLSKTKLRAVNIKDDDKTGAEIYSAIQYLDANEGKVVEDPGYFGDE